LGLKRNKILGIFSFFSPNIAPMIFNKHLSSFKDQVKNLSTYHFDNKL